MSDSKNYLEAKLEDWPGLVLDPSLRFEWHPGFWGYMVRTDPWSIRSLTRDWNIFHLIFEGFVESRANAIDFTLAPQTFVWLSPGISLDMKWSHPFSFTEFRFRLWKGKRQYRLPEPIHLTARIPKIDLWRLFQQMNEELLLLRSDHELMLRTLLCQMIVRLLRGRAGQAAPRDRLSLAQRTWLREFALANHHRRPSISELAQGVQLSTDYFSRIFCETYGVPPSRWLLQERIQTAAGLLHETTLNISQIAEKLGYTDIGLFSRQFKEIMGSSPLRFRAAHS